MSQPIILARGKHEPPAEDCGTERCLFEWYNWITRRIHTDARPPGVSPVLHAFGTRLNDRLPDGKRQQLTEFLPNGDGPSPLDGTEGDGLDEARVLMAVDWAVHTRARTWLRAVGLTGDEAALAALPDITSRASLDAALPALRDIRSRLWTRRDALWRDAREQVRAQPVAAMAVTGNTNAAAAAAAAVAADVAVNAVADVAANAVADVAANADVVAVAEADVAANADVAAVAFAAAVADAAAAAAAVTAADAVAAMAAVAAAVANWPVSYNTTYKQAYATAKRTVENKYGLTIAAIEDSAIGLFRAMVACG